VKCVQRMVSRAVVACTRLADICGVMLSPTPPAVQYNELNGVPMVTSAQYLKRLLRDTLGFDGMTITDWREVVNLKDWHMTAPTARDAVRLSMQRTSIDMSMVPYDMSFAEELHALVLSGQVGGSFSLCLPPWHMPIHVACPPCSGRLLLKTPALGRRCRRPAWTRRWTACWRSSTSWGSCRRARRATRRAPPPPAHQVILTIAPRHCSWSGVCVCVRGRRPGSGGSERRGI
jgi:hypothetical protein